MAEEVDRISQAEMARWCGVTVRVVKRSFSPGMPLREACDSKGQIILGHPHARKFMREHGLDGPQKIGYIGKRTQKGRSLKDKADALAPPETLKELEHLTVREVVMHWGSIAEFTVYVQALKNIADYQHREIKVGIQRGELVPRKRFEKEFFPILDLAFRRLLTDMPESLSRTVIGRVESGGPETVIDVQQMIHDEAQKIIKNLKTQMLKLDFVVTNFEG